MKTAQTREVLLLPHYNSSELYSICCLLHSYKKFPQFSSSFNYFEHDDALLCLKGLVAGTPYSIQKREQFVFEEHFRFILKNIFYLCGFDAKEEIEMASGRIDLIAENDFCVYVIELKMDDNGGINAAVNQMKSRHYADIYAASEKKIICIALEFSKESRGLKEWLVVE